MVTGYVVFVFFFSGSTVNELFCISLELQHLSYRLCCCKRLVIIHLNSLFLLSLIFVPIMAYGSYVICRDDPEKKWRPH